MSIKLTLDKKDLISLVKGTSPHFKEFSNSKLKSTYYDQSGRWDWDVIYLKNCTESQLLEIYRICKHSWD